MQRLRDCLTLRSQAAYLWWSFMGRHEEVRVQLATGELLLLRPPPARDLDIAYEIFVADVYESPRKIEEQSIQHIVDVGANVGFSCLYWLRSYPRACLTGFEPHPAHLQQIKRHLQVNRIEERVTLIPAAAGAAAGEMFLTDEGPESRLQSNPQPNSLPVPVVDWFNVIGSKPIDLLKIDIEGGEYALLTDERFTTLSCRACLLEWHQTPEYPAGRAWCTKHLESQGYQVVPGKLVAERAGLLWAFKPGV